MRRLRLPVLLLPVLLGAAILAMAPGAAEAQNLDQTLERIAAAWHRADAGTIAGHAARGGISLNLDGQAVGPLPPRQAGAGIRRVFEDRESLGVRSTMSRTVGGSPPRAFGEINWTTRARGTTIPERATIFVALVLEDERWRITEIRLIR
jgi:hypothetical protein